MHKAGLKRQPRNHNSSCLPHLLSSIDMKQRTRSSRFCVSGLAWRASSCVVIPLRALVHSDGDVKFKTSVSSLCEAEVSTFQGASEVCVDATLSLQGACHGAPVFSNGCLISTTTRCNVHTEMKTRASSLHVPRVSTTNDQSPAQRWRRWVPCVRLRKAKLAVRPHSWCAESTTETCL